MSKQRLNIFELEKDDSKYLKGVAILTVLFAHAAKAYGIGGVQWIAAIGVSIFLILSGYGIYKSYETNGLKNYWIKKVKKVLIPYLVVMIIGDLIVQTRKIEMLKDVSIIASNQWYISFQLLWYIFFFLTVFVVKKIGGAE